QPGEARMAVRTRPPLALELELGEAGRLVPSVQGGRAGRGARDAPGGRQRGGAQHCHEPEPAAALTGTVAEFVDAIDRLYGLYLGHRDRVSSDPTKLLNCTTYSRMEFLLTLTEVNFGPGMLMRVSPSL